MRGRPSAGAGAAAEGRGSTFGELWNNRLYDEVIARADQTLQEDPLEISALVYRGFAYFYKAVAEVNLEDRLPFLEQSVITLRRALLVDNPWQAETDYVLGKAYYHKGKYYYDLAVRYLEKALAAGFQSEDIYDYLGLACTQLDQVERGLSYFQVALQNHPTDMLLLMIGQSYLQLKDSGQAEEYLIRALNKTEDPAVEKKSRFLLGQLYFQSGQYLKAKEEYNRILELDSGSADAHFYLGEIYLKMNDPVRARAEWRKTLVLDPSHYGARLRYYK